jgi:hypothetical protein
MQYQILLDISFNIHYEKSYTFIYKTPAIKFSFKFSRQNAHEKLFIIATSGYTFYVEHKQHS